jgi:type II secretory pathway component PulJ
MRGFTLFETVIYISLFSFIAVSLTSFASMVIYKQHMQKTTLLTEHEAITFLKITENVLREDQQIPLYLNTIVTLATSTDLKNITLTLLNNNYTLKIYAPHK